MKTFSPVRTTAMHRAHLALGARFREVDGWQVADAYTSADDEAMRARAAVGLADVSAGGKLGVRGEAVDALIVKVSGGGAPEPGRAARVRLDGAESLLCRLAADELLVLTSPDAAAGVGRLLAHAAETVGCAHLTDLTSALAALDLIGPNAPALLARVSPLDLSPAAAPSLAVVQGELGRVRAIIVRLDLARLPAFRVMVAREYGECVWNGLGEAGHDLGLTPVGAAARATLGA